MIHPPSSTGSTRILWKSAIIAADISLKSYSACSNVKNVFRIIIISHEKRKETVGEEDCADSLYCSP